MSYSGAATVAWAKTQVGFHEGPNNYNPYSRWQYGNPYNPWCASFQSMAQYMGGYRFKNCTYGEKGEAYTPTQKIRAQQQGTWRDRYWRAQPGDAVLFDWGNNGQIDHVAIVTYDDGVHLLTIGGNTSDSVAFRTYDRSYVAGFWALSQDKQAQPVLTPSAITAIERLLAWEKRVAATPLHYGDTNSNTLIMTKLLVAKGRLVVPSNTYNWAAHKAVHLAKMEWIKSGLVKDIDGDHFGGPAAHALLIT